MKSAKMAVRLFFWYNVGTMPITVGAIRKLRADKNKVRINEHVKRAYKEAVSTMRTKPNVKNLTTAFSKLDRAAKTNLIHKNTASRLKSRLTKLLPKK